MRVSLPGAAAVVIGCPPRGLVILRFFDWLNSDAESHPWLRVVAENLMVVAVFVGALVVLLLLVLLFSATFWQ